VRVVARWVKDWAESVLKEPDTSTPHSAQAPLSLWERDGVRVPVPPSSNLDTGGPPEHWKQLLSTQRRGPPADWVERVRRGAPQLLEGLDLGNERPESPAVPPKPVLQSPPRMPLRSGGTPPRPEPEAHLSRPSPLPTAPREEESMPPSEMRRAPVPPPTTGPRAGARLLRPARERGPEVPTSATRPQEEQGSPSFPRPEESTPRVTPPNTREVAPPTRARGPSLRPLPETPRMERTPNPAPVPRPDAGAHGDARGLAPKRNTVVAPAARASLMPSEPTPRESPFPREKSRAETSPPLDRASPSETSHPWPEPPELPSTEPTDPLAVLRDWERLRRLEREQRGE
jgi:hypothetical protein